MSITLLLKNRIFEADLPRLTAELEPALKREALPEALAGLNERAASPESASTAIICPLLACPLNTAAVRDSATGICGCFCPGPIRICPNGAPSYYNHITRLCQCRCLGIVCPLNSGPALRDPNTGLCKCSPLPTPIAV